MRTLYISCLMLTSLASAMHKPAPDKTAQEKMDNIQTFIASIAKNNEELQNRLNALLTIETLIDVPKQEAHTQLIGFRSSDQEINPVIHNETKPDSPKPEARIPLTDCYLNDRMPTRGQSATILDILKTVNAPTEIDQPEKTSFSPTVPLGGSYSSYLILNRNELEEHQKAKGKFQRIEGFNWKPTISNE